MAEEVTPRIAESFHPGQRLVDGKLFPRVFAPSSPHLPVEDVFRDNAQLLERLLLEHGALLFRGFDILSASDFGSVVDATRWERNKYVGSATRSELGGGVYTANDADPKLSIRFHHEMSQLPSGWPPKVLFFCETEPAEGGETPIVVSRKVTERMWKELPHFMQKLETLGVLYIKILPKTTCKAYSSSQGWPLALGTTDRREAEKRAIQQYGCRVDWLPDDSLRTIAGPFQVTRSFGTNGDYSNSWFNKILPYYSGKAEVSVQDHPTDVLSGKAEVSVQDHPTDVVFGDGSPLPLDAIETCKRIHEEMCVAIPWQKSDLLVVDNFRVMHGRRPYKPPRKILVALCK